MNLNTGSHRDVFVYKSKYISKKKKIQKEEILPMK